MNRVCGWGSAVGGAWILATVSGCGISSSTASSLADAALPFAVSVAVDNPTSRDAKRFGRSDTSVSFELRRNLIYRPAGDGRKAQRLDLYLPELPGPHPVAVVLPGGGWRFGNRRHPDCLLVAEAMARDGVAAATVSYRPAPARVHPAQFDDCRAAVRFLRTHAAEFELDPQRVVTIGTSAGGHLATLLGTQDIDSLAKPNAVVAIATPFDFTRHPEEPVTPHQLRSLAALVGLPYTDSMELEDWLDRLEELGRPASPQVYLDAGDPPMLLIHGDDDPIVPLGQASRMRAELVRLEIAASLLVIPGGGHGRFLFELEDMLEQDESTAERTVPVFWRSVRHFLQVQFGPGGIRK